MLNTLLRPFTASSDASEKDVAEDLHTYALLFPDATSARRARLRSEATQSTAQTSSPKFIYDEKAEDGLFLHIENVRVIIAQDEARVGGGPTKRDILYDSHSDAAPETPTSSPGKLQRGLSLPRRTTQESFEHESARVERMVSQLRKSSSSSARTPIPTPQERKATNEFNPPSRLTSSSGWFGYARTQADLRTQPSLADSQKTEQEPPARDSREEIESWLDCMFGKPGLNYKGPSTKTHTMKRRVSQPLRSLGSSSDISTSTITQLSASEKSNQLFMITRTFNIPLTPEDAINGKRFAGADVPAHLLNRPPRTPMYALAILIELPHSDSHEHMGYATARWSVIERALDDLNRTMFHIFYDQLLQGIDAIHASKAPRARPYSDDRFASENSYLFTQTMILKLGNQKLKTNSTVAGKVNETVDRVRRGLNVPTVLNGQTKWSVWRDQIRAMRAKSNANFFPVALTATLSNNIRMLESFMSSKDKRCFAEALRKSAAWNCKALDRTVVIAADQNSARRLMFLLSAFMPSTRRSIQAVSLDSRRSSLASGIGSTVSSASNSSSTVQQPPVPSQLSQSILASTICGSPATIGQKDIPVRPSMPPRQLSNSSTSRSLRREFLFPQGIEPSRSSVATTSTVTATPAIPIATRRSPKDRTPSGSPNRPGSSGSVSMNMLQKLQRNNSTNLSTSSESQSKWGSFGSGWSGLRARRESSFTERSDSGNTGEESLRSILKGGRDSTGRKSGQKLVRMVDEAQAMDVTRPGTAPIDSAMQTREATPISSRAGSVPSSHTLSSPSRPASICSPEEPTGPPYQLQYNEWEGVIDIKSSAKKLPSSRTFQKRDSTGSSSTPSSPSVGLGAPTTAKVSSADIDHYVRATGFLEAFHPDFALQAVKPYEELEAEIKAAMRAEPHPPTLKALLDTASDRVERPIDVCSTVLVNNLTSSVKRLTLQRHIVHTRVKPKKAPKPRQPSKESYSSVPEAPSWAYGPKERRPSQDYSATDMSSPPTLVVFTPSYARPPLREEATEEPAPQGKWEEKIVREEFAEEVITAADWTLVAAIDKMLADSEQRLRASSISSRSSSISGRPASRAGSITSSIMAVSQQQCKETIGDALRQIVRSVDKGKTESSSVLRQSIQKWLTQSA